MKACWAIGMMVACGLQAQPQACTVNVYIINGLAVPAVMILNARLRVAAMFREIGVDILLRSSVPVRDRRDDCGAPIRIQLENSTGYAVPADAMAYALPYGDSGTCIHVFLDRVVLNRAKVFANALFAHVLVHEITHVLEQVDRHSEDGVMKAHWSQEDYRHMEFDPLPFTALDVQLIRGGLAKRRR